MSSFDILSLSKTFTPLFSLVLFTKAFNFSSKSFLPITPILYPLYAKYSGINSQLEKCAVTAIIPFFYLNALSKYSMPSTCLTSPAIFFKGITENFTNSKKPIP